jgi:Mg-chelatase subunit ChlD/tetratricopeptide (TPR) repeat protein
MPDHDALEVQVTALLLGELSANEAASLRARIEADPALRALHDRLRIAIELTREATRSPQPKDLPRPEVPRLDPARREQLLAQFRKPAASPSNILPLPNPAAAAGSAPRRASNRREWLAMAAMLVVLLATASGVRLFRREEAREFAAASSESRGLNEFAWGESASVSRGREPEFRRQAAPLPRNRLSLNTPASITPIPASGPVAAPSDPAPVTRFALQPEGRSSPALDGRRAEAAPDRFDDAKQAGEKSPSTARFRSLTTSTALDVALPAKPEADNRFGVTVARSAGGSAGGVPAFGNVPVVGALFDSPAPADKSLKDVAAVATTGDAAGAGEREALARADHFYRIPQPQESFELKSSLRGFYDDDANGRVDGFGSGGSANAGSGGFGGGAKVDSRSYQFVPGTPGGSSPSQSHWYFSNGTATPAEPQRDLARKLADAESEVREDILQQSLREQDKAPARPVVVLAQKQAALSEAESTSDFVVPAETRAKTSAEFFTDPALGQVEDLNEAPAQKREKLVTANAPAQPPAAGTHEKNGQLLFDAGKLEEAAAEFKEALKIDPDSRAAQHYSAATEERILSRTAASRELASRGRLVEVETSWDVALPKLPEANTDATKPAPRRDSDDFGTIASKDRPAPLPAFKESLDALEISGVEAKQRASTSAAAVDRLSTLTEKQETSEEAARGLKRHLELGSVVLNFQRGTEASPVDVKKVEEVELLKESEAKEQTEKATALHALVPGDRPEEKFAKLKAKADLDQDAPAQQPSLPPAPVPQPEVQTATDPFSTFSLNVSDVSFQLAAASLEQGALPAPGSIRTEEFINAFDYRDPMPVGTAPVAFAWERSRDAFAHNRDLLRFSIRTAATGRQAGKPLNLVLLVDNSGSMERADRVRIRHECLRILAAQLQPQDRISVVTFARTARLAADGIPGHQAGTLADQIGSLTPEGGTHLEGALDLAYQTARRHFSPTGINRVVMLTDGAANLGDVSPDSLRRRVEDNRRQGVALDCFGIGWEGLNDDLLESLSRNGDGRYGFINTPEAATANFAAQLAGALQVAASDVKVQVEFNPLRVTTHRQVGYARHQLKKEQFRDNTVDAAELAAAEAGNALYVVQSNPAGSGPIATVRVRFKVPGTTEYREQSWDVPYEGSARALDQSSPALRLAAVASNFAEWLAQSPYAAEVTPDRLLPLLNGIPQSQPGDPRPARLESMIRQARALGGR